MLKQRYHASLPRTAVLLSMPAWVVLAVLAVAGGLSVAQALVGGLVVLLGVGALLTPHYRDLNTLRAYVETLRQGWQGGGATPEPPEVSSSGLDPELPGVLAENARQRDAQRRELHAAIRGNEAVLNGLPDPLLLLDKDGVVRRANPAARQLLGPRVEGRPLAAVLRHPDLLQAVDRVLNGGAEGEVEFTLPGEIERSLSARVARLEGAGPAETAAVLSLHDVTAIRRAEQLRADFVANASHELRTPLSSLLGFIETLQGPASDDPEARERFLPIMLEQARRMSNLVEDLLSLSRIELDEHTPPTGRADLGRILERVQSSLELRAKEKDMTIELEIGSGTTEVVGDEDQLTQVMQNLVDNAIKYGRPGTPIRVRAGPASQTPGRPSRQARRGVAVSVIDQGEGIAREHIPRLTERFYRVDTARSRQLGGTGLGLAIVKHIVNRHRGQLEIDSTPGEGSRFTVYLPAKAPRAGDRAAA